MFGNTPAADAAAGVLPSKICLLVFRYQFFEATFGFGDADENLGWFYAVIPSLTDADPLPIGAIRLT
ncbi:hypothetical protein WH91_14500 [Devosia psychrophila]|uniref:Uncharacterized protein n=1 Tax=Devosia psychrophila TaxID=728005 RepID=A0ABR5DWH5_9HYPH|nr:hypothetical protein WH91_14500 [Devosia psychrophila]